MENNFYTKREDIVNAITHGIGALLAIAALVILIVYAALKGTAWHVVSFFYIWSYFSDTLFRIYTIS